MNTRLFVCIFIFLRVSVVFSQEYNFHQYRVAEGLPTDMVKAVEEDSLGFIWVCTDDGLVKFNGIKFTTYKNALSNLYTKGFLKTQSGKLFAFGDQDFIEIRSQIDTVIFRSVLRGTQNPTDSTLWYPKSIYEDQHQNIWFSEPQSISRYKDGVLKRYSFGLENRSPVFLRSFSFVSDPEGNLFASSYQGNVFRYDPDRDQFDLLPDVKLPNMLHDLFHFKNYLWIAANDGLYRATFADKKIKSLQKKVNLISPSGLLRDTDSTVWVGTFEGELFRAQIGEDIKLQKVNHFFQAVNSFFKSSAQDYWISTDKGIVLMQPNLFILSDESSKGSFIETITQDPDKNTIYYDIKEELFKIPYEKNGFSNHREVLYTDNAGYFQDLAFGKGNLWASNAFSILLFRQEKLSRRWDFSKEGQFIQDIFLDSKNNLWFSQDGNDNVMVITNSLSISRFKVPKNLESNIQAIREGPDGIYVTSEGKNSYLFFKANGSEQFHNVSIAPSFETKSEFFISDLVIHKGKIWLASSEGLLLYADKTVTRIDLGERFTTYPVRAVIKLDDRYFLFANSFGLFRFDNITGDYWLYDEQSGLPSNTVSERGIFVDNQGHPWIGTAYGLVYAPNSVATKRVTPVPQCTEVKVNASSNLYSTGLKVPYGSFVDMSFLSLTFPSDQVTLEWRNVKFDTVWKIMDKNRLSFSELPSGLFSIEVRAKKNGGWDWSKKEIFRIEVAKAYWQEWWFIAFLISSIMIVATISFWITSNILEKRKLALERLVLQRTKELQEANNELTQRNTELDRFVYSASHDLSAPLKSVLGLITVSHMENPGEQQAKYLSMMERSVRKLEEFIKDVVSYSRNTRMPIKNESFNFVEMINGLLSDHEYATNFSQIQFVIEAETQNLITTDSMRLKIVLNNLISNAIKFHRFDGRETPFVKIKLCQLDHIYVITVQDNGKGVDAKHVDRIFEMFYRATEQGQGSGLGLYILKETVLKMNGAVSVKSTVDVGTTFTITLPAP